MSNQVIIPMRQQVKRIPRAELEERSRSELTLLYELIKRNPQKAKEFLRKLSLDEPQHLVI